MKKPLKITLIVLGSIIVLLLLVTFLAGPITKNYLEKHDKELVGREISIGKMRVYLLSGTVIIDDLTLFEDDGQTPFVKFDYFKSKIKTFDFLFNNRIWVKHALLSGLKVNVEQNQTWFNFNSILAHLRSNKTESDDTSGYEVILNDFNIEHSDFRYTDLDVGNTFQLRNISLRIPFIDLSDMKSNMGLDLCFADNATLHSDIKLSENADEYHVNLKLNNLGIDIIEPYLQQMFAIDALKGRFSMNVAAQGRTEHVLDFDLTGDMAFDQLSFQDTEGNNLCQIDSIRTDIDHFNPSQNTLDVNKLHLIGLHSNFIVDTDGSTNFNLYKGDVYHQDMTEFDKTIDTVSSQNNAVPETQPFHISIGKLLIDHSSLVYQDYSLPEPFKYEFSEMEIQSKHLTLDGNNTIQMEAMLNQEGRLQAIWQGNFNGFDKHELSFILSNVKCSDFSPYSLKMFGFPFKSGTLSFVSQNTIVDGNIQGTNKLHIESPKVGRKRRDIKPVYNIPLRLGLYLLTDKKNNLDLDLPISGNITDPKFSYRRTLMKAFTNLLTKTISSPFRKQDEPRKNPHPHDHPRRRRNHLN